MIMDEMGLGSIPTNRTSFSSLLLFNSTHCPYTQSKDGEFEDNLTSLRGLVCFFDEMVDGRW